VACSAVRDAAIECLEEVYKVYGEQLMDVLSSHELRAAHLNLIYSRLAQLGAHVEQTPEQSGGGKPGRRRSCTLHAFTKLVLLASFEIWHSLLFQC
jgi:hypothetical protein